MTGAKNATNLLSGGLTDPATLIGGDQGDYFLGGPGRNVIVGGAGNDTIFAHPANAALKGKLGFQFAATIKGNATVPSVTVIVNGQVAVPPTPITAIYQSSTQDLTVSLESFGPIASVEIDVSGANFTDQNNLSIIYILGVTYNGQAISLSSATYSNGRSDPSSVFFSGNGTVTFPASAFQVGSPFLPNTSDNIDGGGGWNTVVYRGSFNEYTVTPQPDGSWIVSSATTAEGPDTLKNIQALTFSDTSVVLDDLRPGPFAFITLNATTFAPGQPLVVGLNVQNGAGSAADLVLGVLLADGATVVLFSSGGAETYSGAVANLSAFPTELVAPNFRLNNPAFIQFTFPAQGVPSGTYQVFAALLPHGVLADNRVDPGDVLAADIKAFSFTGQ